MYYKLQCCEMMKITYIYLPSPYLKFCILINSSSIANSKSAFFNHIKAFKSQEICIDLNIKRFVDEIFNLLPSYTFYTYILFIIC